MNVVHKAARKHYSPTYPPHQQNALFHSQMTWLFKYFILSILFGKLFLSFSFRNSLSSSSWVWVLRKNARSLISNFQTKQLNLIVYGNHNFLIHSQFIFRWKIRRRFPRRSIALACLNAARTTHKLGNSSFGLFFPQIFTFDWKIDKNRDFFLIVIGNISKERVVFLCFGSVF